MKSLKSCVIAFLFLFCFVSYAQATPKSDWVEIFYAQNVGKICVDKNSISKDKKGNLFGLARTYPIGNLLKETKAKDKILNDFYCYDKLYCIPDPSKNNFIILQITLYDSKGNVISRNNTQHPGTYKPNSSDGMVIKKFIELEAKNIK